MSISDGYLLEVRGRLYFPDRLHERVSHYDTDVGSGVSVCLVCQLTQVWLSQTVRRVSQMQAKHGQLGPAPQGAGCRCASQTCTHQREDYWSSSMSTCLCERMYQTDLLRIAASSTQGMLVAPRTKTPSLLLPTPVEERCPQTLRQPTKKSSRGNNPARLCTPLHSLLATLHFKELVTCTYNNKLCITTCK